MPEFIEGPNTLKMVLLFDTQTGAFNISGPIDNKIFAYGLLELAKETIYNHHRQKEQGSISLPIPLPFRR